MDDRRASTSSDLGAADEEEDHIRVICRVRPPQVREGRSSALGLRTCLTVNETSKTVTLKQASGPKVFTFDHSISENASQESVFHLAGKPATRACIQGYNGTVFCYGQTGSGKTYTMFGPNVDACDSGDDQRGLVPRVLEYLFAHVAREERRNGGAVTHLCRCSFYEIFNERVFDLLDSDSGCSLGGLQTREDMKKGVYVEGLTEEAVDSPHQAYEVLTRGYRNRHVGETAMNRESSRSHAVFTVILESREVDAVDGITRSRCASFNLVDLAGSERQGQTGATGDRLKEASSINKSLSALGNVINALVSGRTRYVPYRDSRLTFLLRDSLGGNAKTFLVACTSPNDENFAETLSTLKFAQRAKMIKNKAIVNENTSGTVEALQKQLRTLRQELLTARAVMSSTGTSLPPSLQSFSSEDSSPSVAYAAAVRRTEKLLQEALERSLYMEQARDLAEKMAGNVQATVDRLEQNLLHEKMVRKMKESQIQRLMKKTAASAAAGTTEEELRSEIEALRKEMEQVPAEAIKWRAAAENAQAQLDALLDEKQGLGMWVEDREKTFATALEEQLKAILVEKAELEAKLYGGGGGGREGGREGAAGGAAQAVSAQSQLQVKLTLVERKMEGLEGENKVLKADRDFNMALLQERIDTTQSSESQAQAAKQDVEVQLASACKDNAILLQRLRETTTEADTVAARQQATEASLQVLTKEVEQELRPRLLTLEKELNESTAALAACQQTLQEKGEEMGRAVDDHDKAFAAITEKQALEIQQLRTTIDEEARRVQTLRAEKEEVASLFSNLQEEHDTLTQLLEFTQGKNTEMEAAMATLQAKTQALGKEKTQLESAWEVANAQICELESQLDKAGGDAAAAAEERQALRELEGVNQTLLLEKLQLQETAEGLRSDLGLAKTAQEQAGKEAGRAAQVLTDLGEQVGRLRGELAEAQAKEQAAKAEAEGLTQEREDLLARANEAEESQAEMGEEMMAYLDEITMLKTRLHEGERAQGEKVREMELALKAMEKEVGEKGAQLVVLEAEVVALRKQLEEQQAADYDAKAAMEAELARKLQMAEWEHTQAMARVQQELADAAVRGAEAARFKAVLGSSQAELEMLKVSVKEKEGMLVVMRMEKEAAEEQGRNLGKQLGEALARERDAEDWKEEKIRWEAEVARAREMEKEAFERCEMVEQENVKMGREVEGLQVELEELKSVNVKLVGHANSRQKIQLHSKLKEELMELSRRFKVLEEENYSLKVKVSGEGEREGETKAPNSSSSSSSSSSSKGKSTNNSNSSSGEPVALSNVTNTGARRAARKKVAGASAAGGAAAVAKKKAVGLEALAAEDSEEVDA
ncbi:kinesin-like protein kif15 [Nannochloropsis oceanica]